MGHARAARVRASVSECGERSEQRAKRVGAAGAARLRAARSAARKKFGRIERVCGDIEISGGLPPHTNPFLGLV